jgi:hypothetical protein
MTASPFAEHVLHNPVVMQIKKIRTLSRPNAYSHSRVLLMRLGLDGLSETESRSRIGAATRNRA